jgi:hypothetical protein
MLRENERESSMIADSKFQTRKLFLFAMIFVAVCVCVVGHDRALGWYSSKYTDSAHGSSAFGVKRQAGASSGGYAVGNCAHCHEQHASIGGSSHTAYTFELFAPNDPTSQTDNFCFECHKGVGSIQDGGITNYTYSKNFGGGTQTFTTIYDAFNPTSGASPSSHELSDVQNFAVNIHGGLGFTSNTNTCVVCHDVHTAQRNYPVVVDAALGGVNTAISRPRDYAERRTNLWGDEDAATSGYNERMVDYTDKYQAPYRVGKTTFEPDGSDSEPLGGWGSNLPNFINYCSGVCHDRSDVYSTERGRNLYAIDWTTSGDEHGRSHEDGGVGVTIAPYGNGSYNYVLSCTDCHEAHGSKNEWLLRTCVNGTDNISVPGPGQWLDFCTACHDVGQHTAPWDTTTDCYNNGICHHHRQFF